MEGGTLREAGQRGRIAGKAAIAANRRRGGSHAPTTEDSAKDTADYREEASQEAATRAAATATESLLEQLLRRHVE